MRNFCVADDNTGIQRFIRQIGDLRLSGIVAILRAMGREHSEMSPVIRTNQI
jgi:hypothetical protein